MFDQHTLNLWADIAALKGVIFCLSFRGRYPFFRCYIGWSLGLTLFLKGVSLWGSEESYTRAYYFGGYIEYALMFAVIVHLSAQLLRPFDALPFPVFRTVKIMACILTTFTLLMCIVFSTVWHYPSLKVLERSALLFLLGGTLLGVGTARHLQIPFRSRQFWITLGLLAYLVVSWKNPAHLPAFLLGELCWLTGFVLPETKMHHPSLAELEELTELVEELLPPKKSPVSCRAIEQKAKAGIQ